MFTSIVGTAGVYLSKIKGETKILGDAKGWQ